MNTIEAILLGIVQGLTEFFPVSSSGHLVIAQTLLGAGSPGVLVEVALHVATLASVVIVYRKRLVHLGTGAVRGERDALGYVGLLALASIPAAIIGVGFQDAIERAFDIPAVTGFMLLITGALLFSTRYAPRQSLVRPTVAVALIIGLAQAFAILPGLSRSGATIAAALWAGVAGEEAAEFSFLMSVPVIAGAALFQVIEAGGLIDGISTASLAIGFVAALIAGVAAIRGLVWLVRRDAFDRFAHYVWAVGGLFLLFLLLRG